MNINLISNQKSNITLQLSKTDIENTLKRLKRVFKLQTFEPYNFDDVENIIEYLLNEYSINTTITTIKTIVLILEYYSANELYDEYLNQLECIIDMKVNYKLYSKASINDIKEFINDKYLYFLGNDVYFTKFRHFLLLSMLVFEIPIKYSSLTNIHYEYHSFITDSDCLFHPIYLLNSNNEFIFLFNYYDQNNNKIQLKHKIENQKVRMLLKHYFAKYANNLNFLFTTSGGKRCTESNIANSLSNFCRQNFRFPLSLGDIRNEWIKYPQSNLKKNIYEKF